MISDLNTSPRGIGFYFEMDLHDKDFGPNIPSSSAMAEANKNPGRVEKESGSEMPLGIGFVPGPFDVICARGKVARDHTGK